MAQAIALVRAGKPLEATRLLQGMSLAPSRAAPAAGAAPADVIDLWAESLSTGPQGAATRTAQSPPPPAEQGFRSRHGDLSYRLHRPAHLPEGAPLLMMLHGCTQDGADFAAGTRMDRLAEAAGMAVLWPTQSAQASPRRCWRWFEAAHQRVDRGEPALLLALARKAAQEHGLDEHGLFVAGLSAGGAMAAVLADCAPGQVRAIAVHSGLAAGAAGSMAGGLAAMQKAPPPSRLQGPFVPTLVLHGDADTTVAPGNADSLFETAVARAGGLTIAQEATRDGRLTAARDAAGHVRVARLMIKGGCHAWSGGDPAGSHTAAGPDASAAVLRFFAVQHRHPVARR